MDHGKAWRKFGLRPRELEIISGVVAGYTIKEIADHYKLHELVVRNPLLVSSCEKLGISCDKWGIATRRELARVAVDHALPLSKLPAKKGKP